MRKILSILFIGILTLGLIACDGAEDEIEYNESSTEEYQAEEIEENGEEEEETEEIEDSDEEEIEEIEENGEEEEEIEEEIVEEAEPTGDLPTNTDLSDDLYSFSFSINGDVYILPFEFSELGELGWDSDRDDLDELTLNPNQHTLGTELQNGDHLIRVAFVNTTENVLPLRESYVGSITIEERHANSGIELILPGGITFGSTMDEIIAVHGEPSEARGTDSSTFLVYDVGSRSNIEFRFDAEDQMTRIQMTNYFAREVSEEFEGDLPEVVQNYETPTDLGDDWESFIVRFDGDLYQIPAPVVVFVENGWIIDDDPNELIAAQSSNVRVTLRKGNQVMQTTVHNFADEAQPIAHGFVTKIEFSHRGAVLPIELPGGITEDSSREEVYAAFGEPHDISEASTSISYTYSAASSALDRVRITFDIETGEIRSIEVQNRPRSLD